MTLRPGQASTSVRVRERRACDDAVPIRIHHRWADGSLGQCGSTGHATGCWQTMGVSAQPPFNVTVTTLFCTPALSTSRITEASARVQASRIHSFWHQNRLTVSTGVPQPAQGELGHHHPPKPLPPFGASPRPPCAAYRFRLRPVMPRPFPPPALPSFAWMPPFPKGAQHSLPQAHQHRRTCRMQ